MNTTIKARNRILSFALALCLLLGMTLVVPGPVTVRAELPPYGNDAEGEPWDGIDFEALEDNGIYYGTYDHAVSFASGGGTYGTATKENTDRPVLWRVMGEEDNNDNLTLLSEYVLDSAVFNPTSNYNHIYEGSSIMTTLAAMAGDIFQGAESAYAKTTTVKTRMHHWDTGAELINTQHGANYPADSTGQTLYLPWGKDGEYMLYWDAGADDTDYDYNLSTPTARLRGGSTDVYYWLRSPASAYSDYALCVLDLGIVVVGGVASALGVRPAFQLNPSSVIFTSEISNSADITKGETQSNANYSATAAAGGAKNYKLVIVSNSVFLNSLQQVSSSTPLSDGEPLTISPGGTLDLTGTISNADNLVYKIVDRGTGGIVGYGAADSATPTQLIVRGNANVTDGNPLDVGSGKYTLYVWAQDNNDDHSHEGSQPMWFPLDVVSDNATLASVAGKPITATPSGMGTAIDPYTDSINVDNSKDKIEVGDIDPTDTNATVNLYTDSNFSQNEDLDVDLDPGNPTDLHIKVTAQDTTTILYYKITVTWDSTAQPLALSGGSLPNGVVDDPYTYDLTVDITGGTAPYTFALDSGTLPNGLNLDTDGKISGTPDDPMNNHQFTVKVTDNLSQTATASYTITITDSGSSIDPDGPDVSPSALNITTGDTETFTISLGESGNMAAQADVSSNRTDVASVDPDSRTDDGDVAVTGELEGTATITVTFSGGDLTGTVVKTVAVTVSDDPDEPDPTPAPSSGRSTSRSSGGSSTPDSRVAKTQFPASAFSWDGDRTLTIDHERITPLGLLSVQWDGTALTRGTEFSVYEGSVIVRFDADFITAQAPGDHTVRVEFLNHTGETTVTVGQTAATEEPAGHPDNDTHNPNTGGYPDGSYPGTDNPNTGDGGGIWPALLLGSLGAAALALYRGERKLH